LSWFKWSLISSICPGVCKNNMVTHLIGISTRSVCTWGSISRAITCHKQTKRYYKSILIKVF
jgi:hypothetical protein